MAIASRIAGGAAAVALSVSLFALSGCGATVGGGYAFDGGQVQVDNTDLAVYLEANPTTGYDWTVDIEGTGLQLESTEYEEGASNTIDIASDDDTSDEAVESDTEVGVGGVDIFMFKGSAAGEQTITFTYKRAWEDTDADRILTMKTVTNGKGAITSSRIEEQGQMIGVLKS